MQKDKSSVMHNVLTVIGTILCIILIPILIINCMGIFPPLVAPPVDTRPYNKGIVLLFIVYDSTLKIENQLPKRKKFRNFVFFTCFFGAGKRNIRFQAENGYILS